MQLVWHRTELRTHDQPALNAAVEHSRDGEAILPVVIIDSLIFARPDLTPRRKAWFLANVAALRESYRRIGADLIVREGEPAHVLGELARELKDTRHALTGAHAVRNYTPYAKERDARATAALQEQRVPLHFHGGQYTHEPGSVLTNEGNRYSVFGAYRKKWQTLPIAPLVSRPDALRTLPSSVKIGKIPTVKSDIVLPEAGEDAALGRLQWFIDEAEASYAKTRNEPWREAQTSKLSYYFNIGALSPRLAQAQAQTYKWKFELTWWDFFADLLDRAPESAHMESRPDWRGFPWRHDEAATQKWKLGQTGFPYVDAGMRELNQTGFMHNNVRMATASFLTKHLMVDWRVGEEIFRGLLLCGDRAQNVGNWQWIAGSGVDAAPYFRIYNPISQGQKRDPKGEYVRRWIPELQSVSDEFVHCPWQAPTPPRDYALPMLDLKECRERFTSTAKSYFADKKVAREESESQPSVELND